MSANHSLNQKAMLAQYREVYAVHNAQCLTLSEQHRGGQYATGYRCLINFCTAFHQGRTKGYCFETSYALMAQDWGLSLSAKSIKRHLLKLSEEVHTLRKCQHQPLLLPLFSKLTEVNRGGYLHVKLHLHPSFIVYELEQLQMLHQQQYPITSIHSPPMLPPLPAKAEQPHVIATVVKTGHALSPAADQVRQQIASRLGNKYKVQLGFDCAQPTCID